MASSPRFVSAFERYQQAMVTQRMNTSTTTQPPKRHATFLVMDTETTGFGAKNRMTELAACRYDAKGNALGTFQHLIKPTCVISPQSQAVTGITPELVRHAPNVNRIMASFMYFMQPSDIIVCHNASFDMGFMQRAFALAFPTKRWPHHPTLCTLKMTRARIAKESIPNYKLTTLATHFGIQTRGAHRALNDVHMTAALLFKFVQQHGLRQILQYAAL